MSDTSDDAPQQVSARSVFRLISLDRLWFLAASAGWVTYHGLPLVPGLLGKAFFDTLQHTGWAGFSPLTIASMVAAAGLARVAVILGASVATARWRFAARSLVQRNVLDHILHRPGVQAVTGTVGESVATMRDDSEAISKFGDWTSDMLGAVVFAAGGVAILLSVDARVTLLVMAPLAVVMLVANSFRARAEDRREAHRTAAAEVAGLIGDIMANVRAIKSAGKEQAVIAHLRRRGDERMRLGLRDQLQSAGLDAVFACTANLGAGLTLLVAVSAMRDGRFSIGDFVLFATYLMQVAEFTGFVGYLTLTYRKAKVAFRRAARLMPNAPADDLTTHHPLYLTHPEPQRPLPAQTTEPFTRLQVSDLTLRHAESGRGIKGVSFDVLPGQLTVVAGRVGAGKTTLVRAMLGLLEMDSGTVHWNGRHVTAPADFLLPPRVAYLPQVPSLLPGSVRENILLGLPDDGRLAESVHTAVLERDLDALPDGLATEVGVRGVRLSGGQVQRVAAARMFARRAQLYVMDDLASALDVETERELWRRIFAAGITCVAVSHRPAVLRRATEVILLEEGQVAGRGTYTELLDTHPLMRTLSGQHVHGDEG